MIAVKKQVKELLPQNLWASSRFFFRTVAVRDESGRQEERWREVIKDDSEVSVFGKVQNIEIQKCPNKKYNKLKSRKIQSYKEDESQASLLEKSTHIKFIKSNLKVNVRVGQKLYLLKLIWI